jgi:hypothetical protein
MSNYDLYSIDFKSMEYFRPKMQILDQLTLGIYDIDKIVSEEDYDMIFRLRHDLIHYLICLQRSIPFGEKRVQDLLGTHKHQHWDKICDQTPDSLIVNGNKIHILELTISRNPNSSQVKISKYSLLRHVLLELNFDVKLEVIVLNPKIIRNDEIQLELEHQINRDCFTSICKILSNSEKLLDLIHTTDRGRKWALTRFEIKKPEEVDCTTEQVLEVHEHFTNKCFHSKEDLKKLLTSKKIRPHILERDVEFLERICDEALIMKTTLNINSSRIDFDYKSMINSRSTSSVPRSILPLPYLSIKSRPDLNRTTMGELELITVAIGNMIASTDELLVALGRSFKNSPYIRARLHKELKYKIALTGPGRKRFIRGGSIEHIKKEDEKRQFSLAFDTDVSGIKHLSYEFSKKDSIPHNPARDIIISSEKIMDCSGVGLNYLRAVEIIYREININALRPNRGKDFILKPTSLEGVYILLYPGPKLRTGELVSIIWFKIIVLSTNMLFNEQLQMNLYFKNLSCHGTVWASDWLSTDANRLDHYNRCYDRCVMAYSSYISKSEDSDLVTSWNKDESNTLGLIILTDLENRRSTSSMLQDVRYLAMSELSIYKYRNEIIKKMTTFFRSSLQLYFYKKCLKFTENMDQDHVMTHFKFGNLLFNYETGKLVESQAGLKSSLPRILTDGSNITFDQMVCEMYFCMLFNKNQDDPTHASFQILTKMLEGESSLKEVKETTNLHLGYSPTLSDLEVAKIIIHNPHKNQFSRKSIEIGSLLQMNHSANNLKNGLAIEKAISRDNMNKTLDEFATYKSSSVTETLIYDVTKKDQNPRRKCLEGVHELLEKGYFRMKDLIKDNIFSETDFHVFKKNQIGGVREILILNIHKRVLINVLETLSRNICYEDDREMLTHGSTKFEAIRSIQRNLKIQTGKQMVVHFNFDKSKWGPSFMPIQFLYLFSRHRDKLGTLFNYILILLIQHQNKRCFFPEHLMRAWMKDPQNKIKHNYDKNLQKLKETFLEDKKTYFVNESNMGQGILHYTSSYLHLCLLSFRDEIYSRLLKRMNLSDSVHQDLLSSDDSLTSLSIPLTSVRDLKTRLDLFIRATEVSERLFNCWTSTTKSSINPIIYEFNSIFGSNLTSFPATFKFAVSSVQPGCTDSFYRMVKEGYNSARQLFENGGNLELYTLAQKMNRRHVEGIFHTYPGGINSLCDLNISPYFRPFHMGYYPIFDPTLMLMYGPEYHNYSLFTNLERMNDNERKLLWNSHKLSTGLFLENATELSNPETVISGLLRVEAKIMPSKRLNRIRNKLKANYEELAQTMVDDPLILFRKPRNLSESFFKVRIKLFQSSASEAMRLSSSSIYYGRISAAVSANAFHIPGELNELRTYKESVMRILNLKTHEDDRNFELLYPFHKDYLATVELSNLNKLLVVRKDMEIKQIRKLYFTKTSASLSNPLPKVLEYRWVLNNNEDMKINRDWIILRSSNPFLMDSIHETLDQFSGDNLKKTSGLILSLMRLFSVGNKKMKAFIYGSSCWEPQESYLTINGLNQYQGLCSENSDFIRTSPDFKYDKEKFFYFYNFSVLALYHGHDVTTIKKCMSELKLTTSDLEYILMDRELGMNVKKRLMMLCLVISSGEIEQWSERTEIVLHKWIKRQQYNNGVWSGPFILYLQMGRDLMLLKGDDTKLKISVSNMKNLRRIKMILDVGLTLLKINQTALRKMTGPGNWLIEKELLIPTIKVAGFRVDQETIQPMNISVTKMVVNDDLTHVENEYSEPLYKVQTGLLRTNFKTHLSSELDLLFFGLRWNKINQIGLLDEDWDVHKNNRLILLDCLETLDIDKPKISNYTKKRLNRMDFDEDEKIFEEVSVETMTLNTDQMMNSLINVDISDFKLDEADPVELMLADFRDTNLLTGFEAEKMIIKTRSLWNRIKTAKSLILSSFLIDHYQINRQTIDFIEKTFKNKFMTWSLIKTYDVYMGNDQIISPRGTFLRLDDDFQNKFL